MGAEDQAKAQAEDKKRWTNVIRNTAVQASTGVPVEGVLSGSRDSIRSITFKECMHRYGWTRSADRPYLVYTPETTAVYA